MELHNYNSEVYHGLCISLMFTWTCSTESVLGSGKVFCRDSKF